MDNFQKGPKIHQDLKQRRTAGNVSLLITPLRNFNSARLRGMTNAVKARVAKRRVPLVFRVSH